MSTSPHSRAVAAHPDAVVLHGGPASTTSSAAAPFDLSASLSCVSCGLCLPHCPTYRERPIESASPRGRFALMKGLIEGQLPVDDSVGEHLDLCLACRACETACPAHLPFGHAMEQARAVVRERHPPPWWVRAIERATLGYAFRSRKLLTLLVGVTDLYYKLGIARVMRGPLGKLVPRRLRRMARMLPRPDGPRPAPPRPERPVVARVAFLVGCVADLYLARTNQATLEVLAANGIEVVMPEATCCGALHSHRGMIEDARELARRTIAAFESCPELPVLTNSAGCGSALKEYGALFAGDAAWEPRARAFARRVQDVTEYLAIKELRTPGRLDRLVAYDDPCHLLHGQGISMPPRRLLGQVPGLTLVPLPESDWCCGSAGIYSVTHAPMSLAILERKVAAIVKTAPQVVATANPGCLLHLRLGLAGKGISVAHVMDLLAEAYRARQA